MAEQKIFLPRLLCATLASAVRLVRCFVTSWLSKNGLVQQEVMVVRQDATKNLCLVTIIGHFYYYDNNY